MPSSVKVEYVGPGVPRDPMMVSPAEAEALEERGLWKRAAKSPKKKEEVTEDA